MRRPDLSLFLNPELVEGSKGSGVQEVVTGTPGFHCVPVVVPSASLDIDASIASIFPMSTTMTIRNLDETVKQKLRMRAARRQTSMEAEVRAILAKTVDEPDTMTPPRTVEEMRARLASVRGTWKDHAGGRDTDEIMKELRGDD